jgi:GH25 family lysozyme M1 (1,4-beta-N-acetylmuramidase)
MILKGIDVSGWQAVINWPTAKLRGIDFAWVRLAGYDTKTKKLFTDYCGHSNIKNARNNNILVGPYYYYGNAYNPILQVQYLITEIERLPGYDLPISIDLEDRTCKPNDLQTRLITFFIELEKALPLERFVIYTSPDYCNSYLQNAEWLHKYYLWISNLKAASPSIPLPWFPGEEIAFQFSSKGNGIYYGTSVESKQIDLDTSKLSLEELRGLKNK